MDSGRTETATVPATAEVLWAYLKAYRRRIDVSAKRNNLPFKNPEPNGMLALAQVWQSRVDRATATGPDVLAAFVDVTRPLLESAPGHLPAIDIAGVAWADAYGILPIRQPPVEQLEWVLESGRHPRSISGVMGSAWRAAFLASASPLLDWQHRPAAERELERWQAYLHSKLDGVAAAEPVQLGELSLTARLAFAIGLAGQRLADEQMLSVAQGQLHAVSAMASAHQPDVPAAVLAQVGAAGHLLGDPETAGACCRHLVEHRLNPDTQLIKDTSDSDARDELSPWIILALLVGAGDVPPKHRLSLRLRPRRPTGQRP